jgi:hypothetical protein
VSRYTTRRRDVIKQDAAILENRLFTDAAQVGRFKLNQNQAGESKLFEPDGEDMEVFLCHIRQLLAVLGSDLHHLSYPSCKT